jgi:hypothetical protein
VLHERVDSNTVGQVGEVRVVRTLPICSSRLGLSGQADVVEFHRDGTVYPVEYKRGKPKKDQCDEVQLCAQALCLEEMLNVEIPAGALFYGQRRRRKDVELGPELRQLTESVAEQIHKRDGHELHRRCLGSEGSHKRLGVFRYRRPRAPHEVFAVDIESPEHERHAPRLSVRKHKRGIRKQFTPRLDAG